MPVHRITHRFTELIGEIIRTCGAIELVINLMIKGLGKDPLLVKEITRSPFARRIEVLRKLMLDRTNLPPTEINSLCDELRAIGDERNVIAHNPVGTEKGVPSIFIFRVSDSSETKKVNQADLERILAQASRAYDKLLDASVKMSEVPVE